MIKNILVPVDGSAHSKKALEIASDLANKYAAKLTVLNVVESVPGEQTLVLGSSSVNIKPDNVALEDTAASVIDACKEIANSHGVTSIQTEVEVGSPARVILDSAEKNGIDMIVMGSRGLGDFAGMLLGSVSHKVNHLASCTCITVR